MKKTFLFAIILFSFSIAHSQTVKFMVGEGLADGPLKDKISSNISLLLTEFNKAASGSRSLDFSEISITPVAAKSVGSLWRNRPFRCDEAMIVERILQTYDNGWQVRDIPIEMKDEYGNNVYQELVVDMNASGTITLVNIAIGAHLYRKIMEDGSQVKDLRQKQMILDYVEQFRTSYNKKDMEFLEMIFSDDALIITGKVVKKNGRDRAAVMKSGIEYKKQTKTEYLSNLKRVFDRNDYIKVSFDDVEVTKHPSIEGYYGVLVKQGYESSTYADEGYVFMLWDFRDEDHPQIHVRTWQPYWMDDAHTRVINKSEIININSFKLK